MLPTLTKRQKQVLDFIKISCEMNGYGPTLTDIKEHFNLSAISTVHEHIINLKKKGYILHELNQARSIKVVTNKQTLLDTIEIPIIYKIESDVLTPQTNINTITLSRNLIHTKEELFAVEISKSTMPDSSDGDIVIVSKTEATSEQFSLAQDSNSKIVVVKQVENYPRKIYTNLLTQTKCFNLTLVGTIILQIKKFL